MVYVIYFLNTVTRFVSSGSIVDTGIILCMGSVSERRRYVVTLALFGWAHTQNDSCREIHVLHWAPWGAFQKHLWALKSKSS